MRICDPEEYKAVEAVLAIYCQEGAAANVEGVGKAFHEKAVMNGHGKDGYVFGSIQNLYDLYRQVGPSPETECHIDVLDVAGDTAAGRIVITNWHGRNFVDFHELIRENGEWKIIARIYQEF